MDRLLQWYENHGYPFCAVRIAEFSLKEEGEIYVSLEIDEGPAVNVDVIRVVGNEVTRKAVITRELKIPLGQRYDQRRVDSGHKRLSRLGFLEEVSHSNFRFCII
jgi:outer membrane protein assembly factor BamA